MFTQQDFQWMELLAQLLLFFAIKSSRSELALEDSQERRCCLTFFTQRTNAGTFLV